jgi:hypothetical protein
LSKNQAVSEEIKSSKQRKLKVAQLLADISTGNSAKIINALDALQVYGDETIIEPLILTLTGNVDQTGTAEIVEFLSSLKSTKAVAKIMETIHNPAFAKQRQLILSTIWNSPLNYSDYVADFIAIAVKGDFMEALECLTILENLEGPFEESAILESQLHLKEYLEGIYPKDAQKDHLISEIALLLKDMDRSVDAD